MVKIQKSKKFKDVTINTDLTNEPYGGIKIVIDQDDDSSNTDDGGEIKQDEDSHNDNYYPDSDSFDKSDEVENTFKELPSLDLNCLLVLYLDISQSMLFLLSVSQISKIFKIQKIMLMSHVN